jgi:hypothetical protein
MEKPPKFPASDRNRLAWTIFHAETEFKHETLCRHEAL